MTVPGDTRAPRGGRDSQEERRGCGRKWLKTLQAATWCFQPPRLEALAVNITIRARTGSEVKPKLLSWVQFFVTHGLYPARLLSPWNSPGKNTGVGSRSLLQGIFPTWGLNPGPAYCRQILYHLSHQGSPAGTGEVAERA